MFDDVVKVYSLLPSLVSVHFAEREEALQAGEDGVGIVGTQQLHRNLDEAGPFLWEVMLQNLAQDGHQLRADIWRRVG